MKDSSCIDEGTEMMVVAIVLCIADLLTTITPIPLIMRLQMPLKQRIGACVLLGLGLLVTFAGIARTYYIWKALIGSWDMTWWVYALWICSIVELNVAVVSLNPERPAFLLSIMLMYPSTSFVLAPQRSSLSSMIRFGQWPVESTASSIPSAPIQRKASYRAGKRFNLIKGGFRILSIGARI